MLAIVYSRVSTEDQVRHGYSLESQLEACRARATALGATDIIEFADEGVSGSLLERPGLQAAMDLVRKRGVSLFVCLDPDRLARNLSHQLILTEEIERAGVRLEFVNFEWKNTAEGKLFYSLRGAIAEYEKEKIKERSARGKRQKAKQGGLTHDPGLYGYSFDKETDKLTPEPNEAAIVERMYRWCAEDGHGPYAIAQMLNEMGIPSPKGKLWQKATVSRILRNPAYRGEMILHRWDTAGVKYNKFRRPEEKARRSIRPEADWIRVVIPAIADEALWYKVQGQLSKARRLRPGYAVERYLLSGLIRCGVCGATIHGNRIKNGKGRVIRYYCCTRRSPGISGQPKCILPFLPAGELEAEVWSRVRGWIENPETLARELEVAAGSETSAGSLEAELRQVETFLAEATRERARLLSLAQKDLVPLAEIEARLKEIKGRVDKLAAQKESLQRSLEERAALPSVVDLKTALAKVASSLDSLDFEGRKEVVRDLVDQVIVVPGEVTIRARVPVSSIRVQ